MLFQHGIYECQFNMIMLHDIVSGLNRRLRERSLTGDGYRIIKKQLLNDVRDATVLQITPAVVSCTVKLLENDVLRAMDALYAACALEWYADLFVTADRKQWNAAPNAGLVVEWVR